MKLFVITVFITNLSQKGFMDAKHRYCLTANLGPSSSPCLEQETGENQDNTTTFCTELQNYRNLPTCNQTSDIN